MTRADPWDWIRNDASPKCAWCGHGSSYHGRFDQDIALRVGSGPCNAADDYDENEEGDMEPVGWCQCPGFFVGAWDR